MPTDLDMMNKLDNIDLSKVETSYPHLKTGVAKFNITKATFESAESKKESGKINTYAEIEFSLAQPYKTEPTIENNVSKDINPGDRGSKITERIYIGTFIDEKDGNKEKWYGVEQLKKLAEAVVGKEVANTLKVTQIPERVLGYDVTLNLKYNPAPVNKDTKETLSPRTEIKGYVRKKS